ncbi:CidA/LrgA family protein [Luteimonas sp. BDR2-5]|uniref:CidA/LrgA family protein n=1 Tax=Proluteimonas luteida TaxID=2878685 RepID=UPI001E2C0629|nr:CidA/LrgA family protein [Luteimonas sp. BDR2-5]MCD9028628.1 CidA/LrgA family protein [Luteimonas sp. BDR2-5]
MKSASHRALPVLHATRTRLRRGVRGSRWAQVAIIVAVWALAEALVHALHLPVPGGILGMLGLLLLLSTRGVASRTLDQGSDFLLAEMLLFFVPAALIVLDNPQLLGLLGLKLLAVVLAGTCLVMVCTALTVDLCCRWSARHGR